MLLGEIETLDDDVVPCGDDTVDAKDIVSHGNLEITICVDASDAITTNEEIKAEDDVLESEDANNLLDLINRVNTLENAVDLELEDPKVSHHNKPKKVHVKEVQPQDYTCDEEDESIIKLIGGCREEHVVVRVDDIFVNFKTFKCCLRRNAYVNGDVFLPINIEEMHWYLAVVNRKRREIQVLDSLGPMNCDDLGHVVSIKFYWHFNKVHL
uniref:Ubiquitin-like protease family profile domain-containing protein n=1 Tax=Setaria viridis TaxID=4556 RepID=A0A4U6VDZ7_SETVI|nr:hypothetical protein SEVIR_3G276000v2 [Setaria viridis]